MQKKAGEKVLRMQHEANMLISELPVNAMSSSAALTSTGCRGGSDATRLAVGVGPIDIKRRNPGVGGVWSNQQEARVVHYGIEATVRDQPICSPGAAAPYPIPRRHGDDSSPCRLGIGYGAAARGEQIGRTRTVASMP